MGFSMYSYELEKIAEEAFNDELKNILSKSDADSAIKQIKAKYKSKKRKSKDEYKEAIRDSNSSRGLAGNIGSAVAGGLMFGPIGAIGGSVLHGRLSNSPMQAKFRAAERKKKKDREENRTGLKNDIREIRSRIGK